MGRTWINKSKVALMDTDGFGRDLTNVKVKAEEEVKFDIMKYMKAGKGIITLHNEETGNRFTFKFSKIDDKDITFVKLLTGSDNNHSYSYMGMLTDSGVKPTRNSKISSDAPSFKAFNWMVRNLNKLDKYPQVKVYHEGVCGKCGRTLTTPESIKLGIGPECSKRI